MTRAGLTSRQRDLLAFITRRIETDGIAPSFDEMKAHLGLNSKSGIHRLVTSLVERGAIVRMPGLARAIALPPTGLTLSPELSAYLRRFHGRTQAEIEAAILLALPLPAQSAGASLP